MNTYKREEMTTDNLVAITTNQGNNCTIKLIFPERTEDQSELIRDLEKIALNTIISVFETTFLDDMEITIHIK